MLLEFMEIECPLAEAIGIAKISPKKHAFFLRIPLQ